MRAKVIFAAACAALLLLTTGASAQQRPPAAAPADDESTQGRVPLTEPALARGTGGDVFLSSTLVTQALTGTPDAPARNSRLVVENRSGVFFNYVTGWATFYDAAGVRCGTGLWTLDAFAPGERVEVDTPGLRLTCTPTAWRVVATTMLTNSGDVASPRPGAVAPQTEPDAATRTTPPAETFATTPPLEINVNGKTIPIQLGNPLEIVVGRERVRLVVRPAP